MAIADSDLVLYLAENMPMTIVGSAGGACSANTAVASVNALFPTRATRETGGETLEFYAKCFFKNDHASLTLTSAVVWIPTQEKSDTPQIQFSLEKDAEGNVVINGTDGVANPVDRPANLADADFSAWGSALARAVGDGELGPGDAIGIWFNWTLPAGLSADASVPFIIAIRGNTPA